MYAAARLQAAAVPAGRPRSGPGGVNVRMPQFRAPAGAGPQMGPSTLQAGQGELKLPRRAAPRRRAARCCRPRACSARRPWLPWWLMPVLSLLAAARCCCSSCCLPQNVVVPEVVGEPSAFEAEEKLTEADLKLAPTRRSRSTTRSPPGTVIGQTPAAGEKAEKGTPVAILVAVGNGKVNVPDITGKTAADAEKALRDEEAHARPGLAAAGRPRGQDREPDPGRRARSSRRARRSTSSIADPTGRGQEEGRREGQGRRRRRRRRRAAAAGGGGRRGHRRAGDRQGRTLGRLRQEGRPTSASSRVASEFNDAPAGHAVRAPSPPGGTKVEAGAKVKLLVSAGQPQVVYDERQGHPARQRRDGEPSSTRSPTAPERGGGPDLAAPTARAWRTPPTAA